MLSTDPLEAAVLLVAFTITFNDNNPE